MTPETWTAETWQVIAAAALVLLVLVAVVWAAFGRSRQPTAVPDAGALKNLHDSHHALGNELTSLRERHALFAERLERHEKLYQDLREQLYRLQETVEARAPRLDAGDQAHRELQEQILEVREGDKVLMQRSDRQERRISELQEELNLLRQEYATARA